MADEVDLPQGQVLITPSLIAHSEMVEPQGTIHDWMTEAANASLDIQNGGTAVVSNLTVARLTLTCLGLTADEVDDRIHFALTGEVVV